MKFPKLIFRGLFLFMVLGLTSCLDITEEYFFRKDGSGKATYLIDMSEMMKFVKMFQEGSEEEGGGDSQIEGLKEIFASTDHVEDLKEMAGISNVKNLSDPEGFTIGFTFDFDNIDALNQAMQDNAAGEMLGAMGMGESGGLSLFEFKGKKFNRDHGMDKIEPEDLGEEAENLEMASMLMADANYTVRYSFDREIKKANNKNGTVSSDGKTLTLQQPITELFKGEGDLSVKMKLKNK